MFERFTGEARNVVAQAQQAARLLGHDYIGTEHLLLGLLAKPDILPARLLAERGVDRVFVKAEILRQIGPGRGQQDLDADALDAIGIDLAAVKERVEAAFGRGALDNPPQRSRDGRLVRGGHVPFTPRAKKVLELSLREAVRLRHKEIGAGHLLLGIMREGDGLAAQLLMAAGVDFAALRAEVERELPQQAAG